MAKFADIDIDIEGLTVRELKEFIRNGIDFINDLVSFNATEGIGLKKPQQHFFDEIQSKTTRGRFGKALGYGLNMKKEYLISKAEDIRRFMKLSRDYDTERVNKAYDTFVKTFGETDRETYGKVINTFAGLDKDIIEKFGSSNIVSLVRGNTGIPSYRLSDMILKAVNNPKNAQQVDVLNEVKDSIKKYINAVNRLKKK